MAQGTDHRMSTNLFLPISSPFWDMANPFTDTDEKWPKRVMHSDTPVHINGATFIDDAYQKCVLDLQDRKAASNRILSSADNELAGHQPVQTIRMADLPKVTQRENMSDVSCGTAETYTDCDKTNLAAVLCSISLEMAKQTKMMKDWSARIDALEQRRQSDDKANGKYRRAKRCFRCEDFSHLIRSCMVPKKWSQPSIGPNREKRQRLAHEIIGEVVKPVSMPITTNQMNDAKE